MTQSRSSNSTATNSAGLSALSVGVLPPADRQVASPFLLWTASCSHTGGRAAPTLETGCLAIIGLGFGVHGKTYPRFHPNRDYPVWMPGTAYSSPLRFASSSDSPSIRSSMYSGLPSDFLS